MWGRESQTKKDPLGGSEVSERQHARQINKGFMQTSAPGIAPSPQAGTRSRRF